MSQTAPPRSFAGDVEFLRAHSDIIVLGDDGGPQIAIAPAWQGRVMTSTAGGKDARGYGWINDELIAAGKPGPHMNAWGGEDRFWMGPEGGQFAIFFKPGDPFDLDHWQTPPSIDTDAYQAVSKSEREVVFEHQASLTNYSGTKLDVRISRKVQLLNPSQISQALAVPLPAGLRAVGFESQNRITNAGREPWTAENGQLSIWILGMFKPAPRATVILPYSAGPESERGPLVNDAYFGKVPADRLRITPAALYFKGDGQFRSKIGLSPRRAKPVCGSYDPDAHLLTIVQYTQPKGATRYVNSMWEIQKEPFAGDVVNSYNDGPPAPGRKPLGPFYELETSSPAAELAPGKSLTHTHRTFHFEGDEKTLDAIARGVLGVGLADVNAGQ